MANLLLKRIKDWATSITAFRTGDVIPVDGPSGTAKMSKDDLLKETAQNALAGNVAQAFDPTRDEENPYLAGETVMYNGVTYIFKNDHFGAWDASDVEVYNNMASRVKENEKTTSNVKEHFSFVEDEGNLYVIDSFGAVCLIIDKDGHLIVPSVTGPGGEFGLTDENGNAALKVDAVGSIRLNIALDSLQKNLNQHGVNLSSCGTDYTMVPPKYVFGTESSTLRGREYFTAIYPEGIVDIDDLQFFIDGYRKKLFQRRKSTSSAINTAVFTEVSHCKIKAPFYKEKSFAVNYIRANRKNAQNKKIFWLAIGDSLTARKEQTFPDGTVYGGYVNGVKQFSAMDNADIGNIDVVTLGTLNQETETIEYENNSITCKTINAGHGGWTTWDFANFFGHTPLEDSSSANYLSREALYYAIGLATKTPFDSSTPGQDYAAFTDTEETKFAIVSTPIGRFKPDCNSVLWEALKLRSDFTGTGDYSSATSDPLIEAYLLAKETDPANEFYSLTAARAYTGDHVWTNNCAFSISEYLGRYRTHDDNGVQLTLGEGTGSKITASNINTYVVMTPTHLTVCLGTNDNGIDGEHQKDIVMLLMNQIKAQLPAANIGYFLPRNTGVYNPGTWSEKGLLNHKSGKSSTRAVTTNKLIMEAIGSLPSGAGLSYIPVYFTSSPVSTSGYDRVVEDIDSGEKLIVAGDDQTHPSAYWYKSTAYQVLSWIYWTLRN